MGWLDALEQYRRYCLSEIIWFRALEVYTVVGFLYSRDE